MAQARPGEPGGAGRFGGTVAGRYRLDEPRPTDLPGAERWSATDQILARPVTVTLVSGPRTTAVLDAARRAALVVDPRLVRILDVGAADGTGYVVTEAVEGRSLAALAARAPLSPDQARAVVGEAASALEAARRRGVHHLALRPETVLLTSASRVVVDGLAVDGELVGATGGGAHAMSRTDTVGLVRVLYAALTGRWPAPDADAPTGTLPTFDEWSTATGPAPATGPRIDAGLPDAPQHDGVPLPPADLVAGVPADLDTLCVVTLGPHDDGPHSPGELVRELEPWRAVRADEIFRAADAGRWHALPDHDGAPGAAAAPSVPAAPSAPGAGRGAAVGGAAVVGGGAAAAGAAAAGAAAAGAAAAGAAAAGAAAVGGAAVGGAAVGSAVAGGSAAGSATAGSATAGGAAAGTVAAAGVGGVARQSVRAAFAGDERPGSRRPGTPPPAIPAGTSFPPAVPRTGPDRPGTGTRTDTVPTTGSVGPGRTSGSSAASRSDEAQDAATTPATGIPPVPPAAPAAVTRPAAPAAAAPAPMPPSIPPAGRTPAPSPAAAPAAVEAQTAAPTRAPEPAEPEPDVGTDAEDTSDAAATDHPEPSPAAAAAVVGIVSAPSAAAGGTAGTDGDPAADADPSDPDPADPSDPSDPDPAVAADGDADAGAGTSGPAGGPAPATPAGHAVTDDTSSPPTSAATAADPELADPVPAPDPAEEPPVETVRFDPIGSPPGDDGGSGPGTPDWDLPFQAEQPRPSLGRRRFDPSRWVLGIVAIGVVVGVVIAIGNVLQPFTPGDSGAAVPVPAATPTAPPATEAPAGDGAGGGGAADVPAAPPVIAGVTSIDPSDGDGEHEELVGRLTDGDPATSWYTHTYNRPDFAGFKDAVGLAITLQAPATVTSVTLDVNGTGGNVEVRATDAANPTAGAVLASGPMNGQTVLTLSQPTATQNLVLWFTSLAQTPDGANKIEISNLSVG